MRVLLMIVASLLLVLGAISMFTPIPGGTLFLALGPALFDLHKQSRCPLDTKTQK